MRCERFPATLEERDQKGETRLLTRWSKLALSDPIGLGSGWSETITCDLRSSLVLDLQVGRTTASNLLHTLAYFIYEMQQSSLLTHLFASVLSYISHWPLSYI